MNRLRRQTSPRAAVGAGRRWRYDGCHARRGDEDRDPALDSARRAPDPAAPDLGDRVDSYFTVEHGQNHRTHAERDLDRLQLWLDHHHLKRIEIRKQGQDFLNNIGAKDVQKYTSKAISWAEGAAISVFQLLFSTVLIVVISIYMLLDMPRLSRGVDRRFPPHPGSLPLITRMERALAGYVKGQALLSLIIGTSAGVGLWVLGLLGWVPGAEKYALLFGTWVALTELIPYLGPWLGAVPPVVYALGVHPLSAVWVTILV